MAVAFNIISVGDVEFLGNVLNAVANVCGTGDFKQLCATGFIIGLLFIGFQTIFQGAQRINLQHTLVCFICYMCFFGPSCTVTIEDSQGSAYTRVVDNVPIGVGVSGMAISSIGYGLTNLIEQAYGPATRRDNFAYAEPLKILADLREVTWSDTPWTTLDQLCGTNCDTKTAVRNYLSECTMKKIKLAGLNLTDINRNSYNDFYFDSEAYATDVTLANGGTKIGVTSCKDAWPYLNTMVWERIKNPNFATGLNRALQIDEWGANNTKQVSVGWDAIEGAMSALAGVGASAQDFVRMSIIEPVFLQAANGYYASMQDTASVLAINSAIEQRNTQWASEQTMFLSAARAFMAFFEGFVYAITPIMGFLLMVGAFGLGLVAKYFMVLAWIQLWLPCLSICNLYTIQGARNAISHANLTNPSFYSINEAYQQAATWVATGGMLAAATPMLALFLISGSVYAFTSLAGRLQGQDHFNEKNVTPDVQQVGTLQTVAPANMYDRMSGAAASGARELMPSASFLGKIDNSVSAAEARMSSATKSLISDFVKSGGLTSTSAQSKAFMQQIGQSVGNVRTESGQTFKELAEQALGSRSKDQSLVNEVAGAAAISATAGAGQQLGGGMDKSWSTKIKGKPITIMTVEKILSAVGIKAGVEGKVSSSTTDKSASGQTFSNTNTTGDSARKSDALVSQLNKAIQSQMQDTSSKTYTAAKNVSETQGLHDSFSKVESAVDSYTTAKSASDMFAVNSGGRSWLAVAENLKGTKEWDSLLAYGNKLSGAEATTFKNDTEYFRRMIGTNTEKDEGLGQKALVMAALNNMANKGDFSALNDSISKARLPSTGAANADLSKPEAPNADNLKAQVEAHRVQTAADIAKREGVVTTEGKGLQGANYAVGVGKVKADHRKTNAEVKQKAAENMAAVTQAHKNTLIQDFIDQGQSEKQAPISFKIQEGLSVLGRGASAVGGVADRVIKTLWNNKYFGYTDGTRTDIKEHVEPTGYSQAQLNYRNAYAQLHSSHAWEDREPAARAMVNSYHQMQDELSTHVYGKSFDDLSDSQRDQLQNLTRGMASSIEQSYQSGTGGMDHDINDFNTTFRIKPAAGHSLK